MRDAGGGMAWRGTLRIAALLLAGAGPARLDAAATQAGSQVTALQVAFVGVDRDVVDRSGQAQPDGALDAHFRLQATFPAWQEITHVALYSADANGYPSGGPVWHTQNAGYPLLGVLYNDLLLDATHVPRIGKLNGSPTLDLYASDAGTFTAGNRFLVEIGLGNAGTVGQIVQLAGGAGQTVTPPIGPGGGNSAPNPPLLVAPPSAYQPALSSAAGVNLSWSDRGDPEGDPTGAYVNVFRTYFDPGTGAWTPWALIFEGWAQGSSFRFGPEHGLAANACYAWRVIAVDLSYRSAPHYGSSEFSVFCAAP
jgi:hypothetical protein